MELHRGGFTLMEVMIASVILFLILGTLVYAFISARRNATTAQHSIQAMQIARTEIETLRSGSYSNINPYGPVALTNTVLSSLGGMKQCTVTTGNNYKAITLAITWINPAKSGTSSQTFSTIIFNTH